jgi:putative RNA 2'-phosphotransferase
VTDRNDIQVSKFLSLILRHQPGKIGLTLDENGWADTQELIQKANASNLRLTLNRLKSIVEHNDKKRFSFSADFTKIRASQGHSLSLDLQLQEVTPPAELYHGTTTRNIESIKKQGLLKGRRHHVHLSADRETARKVGMRYGKPVILTVNSRQMHQEGNKFFLSENGVWLTDFVLPKYLSFPT